MSHQPYPRGRRSHRSLVALPFVAGAVAVLLLVSAWTTYEVSADAWLAAGGMIAFTTVGSLIEVRRPGQAVGRICLAMGGLLVAGGLLRIAAVSLDAQPGHLPPLGAILAVISATCFSFSLFMSGPLLISRFPDGRDSGRLAALTDLSLVLMTALGLMTAFRPGALTYGWIEPVDNPLGVSGIPFLDDESFAGFFVYIAATALAASGLVRRYLRGDSVRRAQIRWFAASIGVSLALLALVFTSSDNESLNSFAWNAWIVSLLLPPVAIAIAILRYRLYDIDRIVSNTIGYGLVTVILSAVFVSVNLVMISVLSRMVAAEDNNIAVAAATLAAAALFNPVRARVQRAVDHRFHRARYDAERTVAGLAARLRDEVDVARLREDIVDVVVRSVEPTGAELWLRPGAMR
jgi:hypothetical protein